jgi:hypothetical protein
LAPDSAFIPVVSLPISPNRFTIKTTGFIIIICTEFAIEIPRRHRDTRVLKPTGWDGLQELGGFDGLEVDRLGGEGCQILFAPGVLQEIL